MNDLYKACNESLDGSGRDVGRLCFETSEMTKDNLTGQYTLPKKDDETAGSNDDCWQLALDSSWQLSEHDPEAEIVLESETANESSSTSGSNENKPLAAEIDLGEEESKSEKWHDKKRCRYLMLLLLLLSVILLAALLGTRSDDPSKAVAAAIAIVATTNSSDVPSSTPSTFPSPHPSTTPSFAPSYECRAGMKEFTLDYSIDISRDLHNATWELRDSCSGEIVSKCMPCSLGTLVLGNRNGRNMQMEILQPLSECIPFGKEYVFHVYATDSRDSCCGFDAASFYVSYDNQLHSIPDEALITSSTGVDYKIYFGESDIPCASDAPSSSPSSYPTFYSTDDPSRNPTHKPTSAPTKSPITNKPTNNPITNPPHEQSNCIRWRMPRAVRATVILLNWNTD
jgi:hypothetical protein